MPATPGVTPTALRSESQPASSGLTVPVPGALPSPFPGNTAGGMAFQYAFPPGFDASKLPASGPAVSGAPPPGAVPIFPIHPAAMYGQMQQMQQQLQAVQQQMSAGVTAPLTTAQQAELARARQRGERAAIAKQKLLKQKAALAAKRAKASEAAAAKAEASGAASGRKRKAAGKGKKGGDGDEEEEDAEEDGAGGEARPASATAADIQGIEAMDVSALAAMSADDQLKEIQKRLAGVECVKEQKRLKRLLRNRVSAQQARERKKSYLSSLEDKSREQENEIQALQQKVQSLQQENTMLRQVVKNMRMKDK